MSKELVLIPKTKYEDLLQQTGDGSKRVKETEKSSNIPAQPEVNVAESSVIDKLDNEKNKQIDNKPTTYVKMKPVTFARNSMKSKQWLKFKM